MSTIPQRQKRTNIRRVRTGCLTCRERRIKCDELIPSCRQCLRSGRVCKKGMRVRFRPLERSSEFHGSGGSVRTQGAQTFTRATILSDQVLDERAHGTASSWAQGGLLDDSSRIEEAASNDEQPGPKTLQNSGGQQPDGRAFGLASDPDVPITSLDIESETGSQLRRGSAAHDESLSSLNEGLLGRSNDIDNSEAPPCIPVTSHDDNRAAIRPSLTFNQPYSTNQGSYPWTNGPNGQIEGSSPSMHSSDSVVGCPSEMSLYQTDHQDFTIRQHPAQRELTPALELGLIQNYISQCASWCESTDKERHFSVKEIQYMMRCGPWRAAAMAISSRQRDLSDQAHPYQLSLELYQFAVKALIEGVTTGKVESGVLAGCVLLTVYEMMTVTYSDWERHLEGCAGIFRANNWNGSTGGLVGCCFWAYARIDIWASFCNNRETFIATDFWLDNSAILELTSVDGDLHANIMIWLVAQVVNFMARRVLKYSKEEEKASWLRLWTSVQKWKAMDQASTEPILILEPDSREKSACKEDSPFPQIICGSDSAVIANIMYHTGCVLLLEQKEPDYPEGFEVYEPCEDQLYYHARRLCGIVRSNARPACLVNSVQLVWIGGRHLRTRSEKFGALELFSLIERSTGWKCGWRSECLRELWSIN